MGDQKTAIKLLNEALECNLKTGHIMQTRRDYLFLGICYSDLNEKAKAEDALEKSWNVIDKTSDLTSFDECNFAWDYIKELRDRGYVALAKQRMKILCERLGKKPLRERKETTELILTGGKTLCDSLGLKEESMQISKLHDASGLSAANIVEEFRSNVRSNASH